MSRIKDLKTNPEHNINVVDIISIITPEKKTKYVEMILRMMKNTSNLDSYNEEVIESLNRQLNVSKEELRSIPPFQLAFYYRFLDSMFNMGDLAQYQKFCEFNERGLIEQNDLTKYTSFEDMSAQVSLAEMKADMKEMETQIVKIHNDDEWLVLRPLTYKSSLKYGANTKWCTASESNYDYFKKYANNGILIYTINKKTGLKVACYKEISQNGELSFWNQKDSRIDSMQSELPMNILMVIKNEIELNPKTNTTFLSKEQILKEEKMYSDKFTKSSYGMEEPRRGVLVNEEVVYENDAADIDIEDAPMEMGRPDDGVPSPAFIGTAVSMESLAPEISAIENTLRRG